MGQDRQGWQMLHPLAHVLPGASRAAGQLWEGRVDILRLPHKLAKGWKEGLKLPPGPW